MSWRRTTLRAVTAAVAGSLVLTACGSGGGGGDEGGGVTLDFTWWGADERAERYEQAIDIFEEQHPDITVRTSFADFAGYWTQRSTDATGGIVPDVFQMDTSYLQEYANNGLLYDVSEFDGEQLDLSTIEEDILQAGVVNEQQVAVPIGTNTWSMLINPDLLAELGVEAPDWDYTWEEYYAFVSEVSEAGQGADPRVYGASDHTTVWWSFIQYLLQQEIEPFAENGEWNFTEEDVVGFLESADGMRPDTFPAERLEQLEPRNAFNSGEAAAEFVWDNSISNYAGELNSENLQILPPPSGSDGQKHMFFKPSFQMAMGANTEHPEEAALLIDFLVNDAEAGQILGTEAGVPASQERLDALEVEPGSYDERVIAYEQRVRDEGYATETTPVHAQGFGAVENEYVEFVGREFSYGTIGADEFASRIFDALETSIVIY